MMSPTKYQLRLLCAFAALASLALAVSCQGFFAKATIQSITLTVPTILLDTPGQAPLQVWGTDTNNNRSLISSGVTWSTEPTGVISIDPNTYVPNGLSLSTTTVTANAQGLTASASATVTVSCISSIAITPTSPAPISLSNDQTVDFDAVATYCDGTVDITDVAAWTTSSSNVATVSSGVVSPVGTGTTVISANSDGITSNPVTVTVTP